MPFFKTLPDNAKVADGFAAWPDIYGPWKTTCQQVLRDAPSALTAAERELIGTFVSKLNRCHYCYEVHNSAVVSYGFDPLLVTRLVEDIETAPVAEKLKPILRYVRKLTLDHTKIVQADVDAALAAGWTEDDVHIAIAITGIFSFMNRLVHGLGLDEDPAYSLAAGPRLKAGRYDAPIATPAAGVPRAAE